MLRWLTLPPDVDATAVELSLTRGRHWLSGAGEQTSAIPIPATVFSDRRDRQARQQSGEPGQAQGIPAFPRRGAACGASLQCPLITQSGHQSSRAPPAFQLPGRTIKKVTVA